MHIYEIFFIDNVQMLGIIVLSSTCFVSMVGFILLDFNYHLLGIGFEKAF